MTWMEAQQVVDALADANGEDVMSAWHTANVLGDSGPTPRLSFEDQWTATLWCSRQRQQTVLEHEPTNEKIRKCLIAMELKQSASAGARWQETQRGFPGPPGHNARWHIIQAQLPRLTARRNLKTSGTCHHVSTVET